MVQSIVIRNKQLDNYRRGSDFIRKHIFPGGMLPSSFQLQEIAFKAGLEINDIFRFGRDYAITLEKWLEHFDNHLQDIKNMGYSNQFIRKWRFYLAGCSALFHSGCTDVMQIELCKI